MDMTSSLPVSIIVPAIPARNETVETGSNEHRQLHGRLLGSGQKDLVYIIEGTMPQRMGGASRVQIDLEVLPRRIEIAKKAIHLQIVKLHKTDDAGNVWALMDALSVLDDLLRMNQTHLSRRA